MSTAIPEPKAEETGTHELVLTVGQEKFFLSTGKIARQAGGAVVVRQHDALVLVTAVAAHEPREGIDFFPLTVEYREKAAAGGYIPGGFTKRELRPSDDEILISRIIDRSIRPLFPKGFKCETQVIATVMSADERADQAMMALLGASTALSLSNIPWNGPVIGIRVGCLGGKLLCYPSLKKRLNSNLDFVITMGEEGVSMVEGAAAEVSEQLVIETLSFAQEHSVEPLQRLKEWTAKWGKDKLEVGKQEETLPEDVATVIQNELRDGLKKIFGTPLAKHERKRMLKLLEKEIVDKVIAAHPNIDLGLVTHYSGEIYHHIVREWTVEKEYRLDGRGYDEIRPINIEMGWLPRTHGSAVFTRGETQAVVSCTLGTASDELPVETLQGMEHKRFFLHYNFPPYCVGEVRPIRGPGRREIGHGALASRALERVIPDFENFPYTIRVVSDITESNGSSSMASVCGGSLALLDAGVPIREPVAGIAMGLISEAGKIAILSDILGDEDHLGDMDFKVTGTRKGITAVQMDNKLGSLERHILEKALAQARKGKEYILSKMENAAAGEKDMSPFAPRVKSVKIRPSKIGGLIGPGGKNIQAIQSETNSKIEIGDDGLVTIYASNERDARLALEKVEYSAGEPVVGDTYQGVITAVKHFGVFVKIFASTEGLVHVSELDGNPESDFKIGQELRVKVLGVDNRGRIQLSQKQA